MQAHISLRPYNTFWMDEPAEALLEITDAAQFSGLTADTSIARPLHILGGGSNVLLTAPVYGTVLLNRIKGIVTVGEDEEHLRIRSGAGEVWHDLVSYAIERGLGGIENLALIPGTVGASPIQNIGAYGVEVADTISEVEAWDWEANTFRRFTNEECRFGYRDSIFKGALRGHVMVTAVTFRLSKHPVLHMEYGAIRDELQRAGDEPGVVSIAEAVMRIRRSKLPDPAVIGNGGSFFKNPVVPRSLFNSLKERHPGMPSYPSGEDYVKVPAGWLIEQCGWKGFRRGDAGVHAAQALVLVNYGNASGKEIWALSEEIVASIEEHFGIVLEREVQVW